MGKTKMKNIGLTLKIYRSEGSVPIQNVKEIEKRYDILLPKKYIEFISKNNGARILKRYFDFFDIDRNMQDTDSIAFCSIEKIFNMMKILKEVDEEELKANSYFPARLIVFGDDGGGDFICFDYRNHNENNPPIVLWSHDVSDNSKRISFIANNFEEFINMLYEPKDEVA